MKIEDLREDAVEAARAMCSKVEVPIDAKPESETGFVSTGLVTCAWRDGFVAGWATREVRDDEPPVDAVVWLRDGEGTEYVAVRSLKGWITAGVPGGAAPWRELLGDVVEWGRMTKEER